MLEHAKKFLSLVMPDFPTTGTAYLNIHWASPNERFDPAQPKTKFNQEKWWDGRAATSLGDAIAQVAWALKLGQRDIYVCMSLQGQMEEKVSQKGHSYRRSIRSQDNVVSLRSFYLDVDVKEGAYETTEEALEAFKAFLEVTELPMPSAVVLSGGGGFHAHWATEEILTQDEWQATADKLSAAATYHELKCDTQCTIDSARILRVPETLNFKYDPPTSTKLLSSGNRIPVGVIRAALEPYEAVTTPRSATPKPGGLFEQDNLTPNSLAGTATKNDELGANITDAGSAPKITVEELATVCPFTARTLATGGRDNNQPLWFITGVLASYLDEGREALHQMSNQHVGYSAPDTDAMYERVTSKGKAKDWGWPQCSKIASYGTPECQGCPFKSQGQSPLNFFKPQPKTLADNSLPDRFVRSPDGIIMFRDIDENGVTFTIPICHYPITNGWLSNNPWTFHFKSKTETGRTTEMEIPTEVIFAKEGLNKYLGAKGFFCTDKQFKLLKEFFVSWLQRLQGQKDSVISAAPFGWSVVDGKIEGFTYAGRVWINGDDRPAANPNPVLAYQYTPKGDLSVWRDVAKVVYEQNRPGLDAILAVGFAGPLVRFTGFAGLILNSYSAESGIGKTTAMKVSQSIWGNPVMAMQGLNDTTNSVLGKMGQIRSLPMYWDEIKTEAQVKRFCSVVFDLTGGREKSRMNADATLKMSGTWQTMMVSASNDSLVDGMAREVGSTTAGLHRLFEFSIPKPAKMSHDIGTVQRLLGKLDDNYGFAGLAYAKFLGAHWRRIEAEVAQYQDDLYREVSVKQEERMWIATMAVLLKGAEYGNELHLTNIDVPALKTFLLSVLTVMRAAVDQSPSDLNNDMSVSSILAEFLNSTRSRNTLITNRIWVAQGKPPKGAINIITDLSKVGEIMVQIGRDDGLLRISSTGLTRWMGERNYSRHTFIQRLEKEFGLRKVNGKLGGGTEMSCAMEHLVELDMNHPKLAPFIQ